MDSYHADIRTKKDLIKHLTEQQGDHSGLMVIRQRHHYTLGNLIDMHNHLHVSYIRMGHLVAGKYGI